MTEDLPSADRPLPTYSFIAAPDPLKIGFIAPADAPVEIVGLTCVVCGCRVDQRFYRTHRDRCMP